MINPKTTNKQTSGYALTTQAERNNQPAFPLQLKINGFLMVALFLGSLAMWSALAPIEGAVISQGVVTVASFRKQIQHLEGGIVDNIYIKDGDKVVTGQILVKLQDIKTSASLKQLEAQYIEAQAVVARLLAERDNMDEIVFPEALIEQSDIVDIHTVMSGQTSIFKNHRTLMHDRQAVIAKKIDQTKEEIKGLHGQIKAKKQQIKLIIEEAQTIETAFKKQLVAKTEVLQIKQHLEKTRGELISKRADLGRLEQNTLELQLQKSETAAHRTTEVSEQLRLHRANMFDLSQKVITARDVQLRTEIISPIDGVVVNLAIHSNSGVITAGQPLLEIVPYDDELVIEAHINPEDIDEVWTGMSADVRLTSLSRRKRIPLAGVVTNVSADRLIDPITGANYYRARIVFSHDVIKSSGINLIAGMGADVFLKTSARTPIDYLLSPITKSLQMGLREE